MDRLNQISSHATSSPAAGHPMDPLSPGEISAIASIIKKRFSDRKITFNNITLKEPSRKELNAWTAQPTVLSQPERLAAFVVLQPGLNGVIEGVASLTKNRVISSKVEENVHPTLTVDDLISSEEIIRSDPNVIEQCRLSGIQPDEMHMVYCDPWAIGYDERWGTSTRLQQALMYFRSDEDDSQYSHPLDFCPILDTTNKKVISIDIPQVRRPLRRNLPHANFQPKDVAASTGFREVKPIQITQPEGVNFKLSGNVIEWQNFKMHIGFNYREGIVLSDMSYSDNGNQRPLFARMSLVEMVVPYGSPNDQHYRKHALDIGEYGAGYNTNPLLLGCDCKGEIHYMDAHFSDKDGTPITTRNAICIHEEDDGTLFKHSDFRDEFKTTIVTRSTKLVISQIFTIANYEYMVYWQFYQDGSIHLEVKLTGILNTYVMNEGEDLNGFGTCVYPGVSAQHHQHLLCARFEPTIDGDANSLAVVDAEPCEEPVGHPNNKYGNGFRPKRTVLKTAKESQTDYDGHNGRTWDFFNPNKLNPYSEKPVSYKLVSKECPPMLAKPGSLVWKRAGFARHTVQAVPLELDGLYPAGPHVPQTSGEPTRGITEWIDNSPSASIENKPYAVYHTFGVTHFPAPEDFPVMPREVIAGPLLRPRNFFTQNPGMSVPPSHAMTTSEARNATNGDIKSLTDNASKIAFTSSKACCANETAAAVEEDLCHCTKRGIECQCLDNCSCKK